MGRARSRWSGVSQRSLRSCRQLIPEEHEVEAPRGGGQPGLRDKDVWPWRGDERLGQFCMTSQPCSVDAMTTLWRRKPRLPGTPNQHSLSFAPPCAVRPNNQLYLLRIFHGSFGELLFVPFGSLWGQEPRNALEGVQALRSIKKTKSNHGTCKRPLSARRKCPRTLQKMSEMPRFSFLPN